MDGSSILPAPLASPVCSFPSIPRPSHMHFGSIIQVLYLGIDSLVGDQLSHLASEPQLTMTSVLCDFISDVWMRDPALEAPCLLTFLTEEVPWTSGTDYCDTETLLPAFLEHYILLSMWANECHPNIAILLQPQGLVFHTVPH